MRGPATLYLQGSHSCRCLLLMSGIDAICDKAPDDHTGQPNGYEVPVRGESLLLERLAAFSLGNVRVRLQGQVQELQKRGVK